MYPGIISDNHNFNLCPCFVDFNIGFVIFCLYILINDINDNLVTKRSNDAAFKAHWKPSSSGLEQLECLRREYVMSAIFKENITDVHSSDINETKILAAANQFISLGLKDVGYEYVNIDDCWASMTRDPTTGQIVPDPVKFPNGIAGLVTKIHALGLKAGIYGYSLV
ncbi:hypothetical protein C0991_011422 [Blastosporella zonata]|nr:hypothetical protein C0991_011422 [Blastosporella zonata]